MFEDWKKLVEKAENENLLYSSRLQAKQKLQKLIEELPQSQKMMLLNMSKEEEIRNIILKSFCDIHAQKGNRKAMQMGENDKYSEFLVRAMNDQLEIAKKIY